MSVRPDFGNPTRLPAKRETTSSSVTQLMTRRQLEHIIRAADVSDIVVIGSQAILGSVAYPPVELIQSMEADVFPKEHPENAATSRLRAWSARNDFPSLPWDGP
jgi:hypothetical protein